MTHLDKIPEYFTVIRPKEIFNKVKNSRFYATAGNCKNKNEAENFIQSIKVKHSDASHNVNAYRVYENNNIIEYADDDGEPGGSSGLPVLKQILGHDLINTVVVVTRYFGGTKLGIGGLIRAYGGSADMALKAAGKKKLSLYMKINLKGPYSHLGTVLGQLEKIEATILNTTHYKDGFLVKAETSEKLVDFLEKVVKEKTSAKVELQKKELYYKES
ncbi:MAG: IMPACT family protein [Bacillota bacterium]